MLKTQIWNQPKNRCLGRMKLNLVDLLGTLPCDVEVKGFIQPKAVAYGLWDEHIVNHPQLKQQTSSPREGSIC